jgi:hypothetical protein
VDDVAFDIERHVYRVEAAQGCDRAGLFAIAKQVVAGRFDHRHPPWKLAFVDGLEGDDVGLVVVLDHTFADGVAGMAVLTALFDSQPTITADCVSAAPPTTIDLIVDTAKRPRSAITAGWRYLRHPLNTMRSWKEVRDALFTGGPSPPSSLNRPTSPSRTLRSSTRGHPSTSTTSKSSWTGSATTTNRSHLHQGIDDHTPAERYRTEPIPAGLIRLPHPGEMAEPGYPPGSLVRQVTSNGHIGFPGKQVCVGRRYARALVQVVEFERLIHIYHGDTLIRVLTIDPDRYYQPKPGKEPPHPQENCQISSRYKVSRISPVQTHSVKYLPDRTCPSRSFGIFRSMVPTRVSHRRVRYPLRRLTRSELTFP